MNTFMVAAFAIAASAAAAAANATKTLTLPGGATMELIYVAPGAFTMGSPSSEAGRFDDETQHQVTLTKGFWLGKYEVTQRQWRSVMGNNPSRFKGDDRPVEIVSWDDCQKFIQKVNARLKCGARLPTEAEWEYACRAGTTTAYSWGNAASAQPQGELDVGIADFQFLHRRQDGLCALRPHVHRRRRPPRQGP